MRMKSGKQEPVGSATSKLLQGAGKGCGQRPWGTWASPRAPGAPNCGVQTLFNRSSENPEESVPERQAGLWELGGP